MIWRWWKKFKAWEPQRKQGWLQKWAQDRQKGKIRFVLREALLITMIYLTVNELFRSTVGLETIFVPHFTGFIAALIMWANNESRYRNALAAGGINPPQINAN